MSDAATPGAVLPFSEEQLRLLVNLEQQYEVWIEAERRLFALPYGLKWKRISGSDYLYAVTDWVGNGRSLGTRPSGRFSAPPSTPARRPCPPASPTRTYSARRTPPPRSA